MAISSVYAGCRLAGTDPLAMAAGQMRAALLVSLPLTLGAAGTFAVAAESAPAWLAVVLSGAFGLGALFALLAGMVERQGPTAAMLAL